MRKLLRVLTLPLGLSVVLASVVDAAAQSEPAKKGFAAFHLLQTRNVFDPNRRAPRSEEPRRSNSRGRPDSFTLTGTMVTESKTLAFFSGSRSEFNRVIPAGESVGDFKLKAIEAGQVQLERDGKPVTLPIGRTMQLDGTRAPEGPEPPEEQVETTPPQPGAPPPSTGTTSAPGANGAPPPSNDKNEVLRRMMERRQKEMSK